MKSCELCKSPAKVYCDSDQARLCWTCDSKVHSANFLVARHSRSLLCRLCQSPTPWNASGEKLGPSAVSICEKCVVHGVSDENDVDDEYEGDESGENEFHVVDDDEEEEEGDKNQVVPLSNSPPPATSSSSSDDCSVGDRRSVLMKRKRENDDVDCLSVQKLNREPVPEFAEAVKVNGGTLYEFLPLNSEAMGEKPTSNQISGEKESGACKRTRTVGLDLNSSDC